VIKYTQRSTFPTSRIQEDLRKFHGMDKPLPLIANADVMQQGKRAIASSDLKVVWQKWRTEDDNLVLRAVLASLIR
jgi:hypothetical protein